MEKVAQVAKQLSLQDSFLNQVRKTRSPVCIFLVNGIKLKGFVRSFDQYVVVLSDARAPSKPAQELDANVKSVGENQQMVYKHAISTIVPGSGEHQEFHRDSHRDPHREFHRDPHRESHRDK